VNLAFRLFAVICIPMMACSGGSAASNGGTAGPQAPGMAGSIAFDGHLLVDQFGYRPGDVKVAVVRNPQSGFDSAARFVPGATYQVRRTADGSVVFGGTLTPWQGGAVELSSGDNGWWFDFSVVNVPGSYFIYDTERNVRSATFNVDQGVYRNILKAAMRTYYYQRSGAAKRRPYADPCWADDPAYLGPDQDLSAHDVTDQKNKSKFRDLSGGWFDAGDTNKYVTFAAQPVHQLLTAYQENPGAFTDDFNIPESGNGVPDVLDEVKWETDWLKKMQYPDGSVALKVGEIVYALAAPPSSDHNTRYYIPSCTSSTISAAGMLAHASYVFDRIPALSKEAADLKPRAIAAWNNYQKNAVKQLHCDTGIVHAGNADLSEEMQNSSAVVAAVYLFAITNEPVYDKYVQAHYRDAKPYRDIGWSRYQPEQGESLLFYATQSNSNPDTRRAILGDKLNDVRAGNQVYGFHPEDDLYRAFMHDAQYHWGSNNPRAGYGNSNIDAVTYNIAAENAGDFRLRALEVLHYFHGVNPFAMVYLSNMYSYGATQSANQIYHTWFARDTKWSDALSSACGPAPGYVPGGPNAGAARDGVPSSLAPPTGQPLQKSYKDWNAASPDSSWAVTEPAIYYQSAYVKLLSKFVQQ
jgi:endoglucanase